MKVGTARNFGLKISLAVFCFSDPEECNKSYKYSAREEIFFWLKEVVNSLIF